MSPRVPLAVVFSRGNVRAVAHEEHLNGLEFHAVVWMKPPTNEARDLAATRMRMYHGSQEELVAVRMYPPANQWDESPMVCDAGTSQIHCENTRTVDLIQHIRVVRTVGLATLRRGSELTTMTEASPAKRERLSTWLARQILQRMPREDVEEVMAACVARQLDQ